MKTCKLQFKSMETKNLVLLPGCWKKNIISRRQKRIETNLFFWTRARELGVLSCSECTISLMGAKQKSEIGKRGQPLKVQGVGAAVVVNNIHFCEDGDNVLALSALVEAK